QTSLFLSSVLFFFFCQTAFVVEDISNIIKEAVDTTIGSSPFQTARVNAWTSAVVETCLSQLAKLGKPFKYIVTCIVMQKNGAGLHAASSCFWDNTTDGERGGGVVYSFNAMEATVIQHSNM
uniref:Dynein light chain Tctex-type 1 n=1 Tax=Scleropages formosus TaxID=113540 RepID=A0A8C9VWD3_SCLFO